MSKRLSIKWCIMCREMKTRLLVILLILSAPWAWAQSTIVYSPGPGFWIPQAYEPSAKLDMNNDGTIDFTFSQGFWIVSHDYPSSTGIQQIYVGLPTSNYILNQGTYVASVPPGEWIGLSTPADMAWSTHTYAYLFAYWFRDGLSGVYGLIGQQGQGYLGVRFYSGNDIHYGWIFVQGLSVVDWAYESRPNEPIRAGAKPVPVPLTHSSIDRPGHLRIVAETEIGKAYQVQFKDSLLDFSWSNLSFALPASGTSTMVDLPMTERRAFYRIVEAD